MIKTIFRNCVFVFIFLCTVYFLVKNDHNNDLKAPYNKKTALLLNQLILADQLVDTKDQMISYTSYNNGQVVVSEHGELRKKIKKLRRHLNKSDATFLFWQTGQSDFQYVKNNESLASDTYRGVYGLQFCHKQTCETFSPLNVLSSNLNHQAFLQQYIKKNDFDLNHVKFRYLYGEQWLFNKNNWQSLYRGHQFVSLSDVNEQSIKASLKLIEHWYKINSSSDGHIPYSYFPAVDKEDSSHSYTIRLTASTYALNQLAEYLDSPFFNDLSYENLKHNLSTYFVKENGLGLIDYEGVTSLGALAFVNLGIFTNKNNDDFKPYYTDISKTIDHLWSDTGAFTSYYRPSNLNLVHDGSQDFYPGETLLLWAYEYQQNKSKELLSRFMKSFEHYKRWHLDDSVHRRRHPAFIPWQTQAYYKVWELTKNDQLKDFIFLMNDWLLPVQERHLDNPPDQYGRFYDPVNQYGIAHASATAAYIEGLVDAYQLALRTQEKTRANLYKEAIIMGLRSLLQLQYTSFDDFYYIQYPSKVKGAFKTSVVDHNLRIDIQQHAAIAMIKVLKANILK